MQDAEACFMIAARNYTDKTAAVRSPQSRFSFGWDLNAQLPQLNLQKSDYITFKLRNRYNSSLKSLHYTCTFYNALECIKYYIILRINIKFIFYFEVRLNDLLQKI